MYIKNIAPPEQRLASLETINFNLLQFLVKKYGVFSPERP